jgi:predicted naringenin-chalcone synthase
VSAFTGAQIVGIGLATPAHSITQAQAARLALDTTMSDGKQRGLIGSLYSRAGVAARGSVVLGSTTAKSQPADQAFYPASAGADAAGVGAEGVQTGEVPWPSTDARMRMFRQHAGVLALSAARSAMAEAGVVAGAVTHLVTVSCTGLEAPGVDIELVRALGLGAGVVRLNLGFMGCHGGIVAVRTAAALAQSHGVVQGAGGGACVLAVCVELCTLHFQRTSRVDQHVANALFADGAAAVVVRGTPGEVQPAAHWPLGIRSASSMLFGDSVGAMGWRIGNQGFEMSLDRSVPALLEEHLGAWIWPWLRQELGTATTAADVRWAVHPGGPRVLDAVERGLGIPAEGVRTSRGVLAEHGNMSSATVLFILRLEREQGALRGDRRPVVMLAFGPGLTGEGALVG